MRPITSSVSTPRAYPLQACGDGSLARVSASPVAQSLRTCSRTACARRAVATLTYVYADSTAVLGPLATFAEPHAYDLCDVHSERLSAPRGWEVLRLALGNKDEGPRGDDLLALADAVREAAIPVPRPVEPVREGAREVGRKGHLRILRTDGDAPSPDQL